MEGIAKVKGYEKEIILTLVLQELTKLNMIIDNHHILKKNSKANKEVLKQRVLDKRRLPRLFKELNNLEAITDVLIQQEVQKYIISLHNQQQKEQIQRVLKLLPIEEDEVIYQMIESDSNRIGEMWGYETTKKIIEMNPKLSEHRENLTHTILQYPDIETALMFYIDVVRKLIDSEFQRYILFHTSLTKMNLVCDETTVNDFIENYKEITAYMEHGEHALMNFLQYLYNGEDLEKTIVQLNQEKQQRLQTRKRNILEKQARMDDERNKQKEMLREKQRKEIYHKILLEKQNYYAEQGEVLTIDEVHEKYQKELQKYKGGKTFILPSIEEATRTHLEGDVVETTKDFQASEVSAETSVTKENVLHEFSTTTSENRDEVVINNQNVVLETKDLGENLQHIKEGILSDTFEQEFNQLIHFAQENNATKNLSLDERAKSKTTDESLADVFFFTTEETLMPPSLAEQPIREEEIAVDEPNTLVEIDVEPEQDFENIEEIVTEQEPDYEPEPESEYEPEQVNEYEKEIATAEEQEELRIIQEKLEYAFTTIYTDIAISGGFTELDKVAHEEICSYVKLNHKLKLIAINDDALFVNFGVKNDRYIINPYYLISDTPYKMYFDKTGLLELEGESVVVQTEREIESDIVKLIVDYIAYSEEWFEQYHKRKYTERGNRLYKIYTANQAQLNKNGIAVFNTNNRIEVLIEGEENTFGYTITNGTIVDGTSKDVIYNETSDRLTDLPLNLAKYKYSMTPLQKELIQAIFVTSYDLNKSI